MRGAAYWGRILPAPEDRHGALASRRLAQRRLAAAGAVTANVSSLARPEARRLRVSRRDAQRSAVNLVYRWCRLAEVADPDPISSSGSVKWSSSARLWSFR